MKITNSLVAEELGGLPKNKLHCSNLGADALHAAIDNYRKKPSEAAHGGPGSKGPEGEAEELCACPYCEGPLVEEGGRSSAGNATSNSSNAPPAGTSTRRARRRAFIAAKLWRNSAAGRVMNEERDRLFRDITRLKAERDAVIVAHNYQSAEVQDVADFVGDSLELSQKAAGWDAGPSCSAASISWPRRRPSWPRRRPSSSPTPMRAVPWPI